jgi:hypothetical protein
VTNDRCKPKNDSGSSSGRDALPSFGPASRHHSQNPHRNEPVGNPLALILRPFARSLDNRPRSSSEGGIEPSLVERQRRQPRLRRWPQPVFGQDGPRPFDIRVRHLKGLCNVHSSRLLNPPFSARVHVHERLQVIQIVVDPPDSPALPFDLVVLPAVLEPCLGAGESLITSAHWAKLFRRRKISRVFQGIFNRFLEGLAERHAVSRPPIGKIYVPKVENSAY